MSPEPEFTTAEDVLQIHDQRLATYGGAAGIRDQTLLELAMATPQASFGEADLHEDLVHMAAAYASSCRTSRFWTATSGRADRRARLPGFERSHSPRPAGEASRRDGRRRGAEDGLAICGNRQFGKGWESGK